MAGKEGESAGFVEKTAWYSKWGGLGIAVVGAVTGAHVLIAPGLLLAGSGLVLENRPK